MKSIAGKSAYVLVALALALVLVALPVSATPSEDLGITATITFDIASGTMHGTGIWEATDGLIVGEGTAEEDHFVAGWPPGAIFKTAHLTETWEDGDGSITIQTQLNVDEWIINGFNDVSFVGSGHWVVKSGDGAYENFKGQGTVAFAGAITPDSCPPPFSPCNLISVEEYQGSGRFDP